MALVSVLAVTAGFGGLDKGSAATQVTLGETYDNGMLQLTPRRFDGICDVEQLRRGTSTYSLEKALEKSWRVIALYVTVENLGNEAVELGSAFKSKNASEAPFTLADAVEYEYFGAYRPSGRFNNVFAFPPGKKLDLTLYWGVAPDKWDTPGTATIRMYDLELREDVNGTVRIFHTTPIARYGNVSAAIQGCG
ncbi:hypothetical protein FZI91_21640 [Mycobacterium sp. CBMA271]|uniref:hypothetical protein n=1 Tax=Mycobacteroides sp. CBMA 271 TaxID=2606608 RepID=UPI0012DE46AD|nr:hypothetical protein [Mycobacteroides sp. CBMA 271]MUM24287.1 hypothetical protein [Mycobacteroides sp. CBMA 271]